MKKQLILASDKLTTEYFCLMLDMVVMLLCVYATIVIL